MEEYDLLQELNAKLEALNKSVRALRKTGTEYAEKEQEYKMCLNKTYLRLRSQNIPVTGIQLMIYGEEEVARKRLERDIAETVYKANQESINALKLEIKILDSQISREWSSLNEQ